ncbi:proline iminopeptidase [Candidatus Methanoplasma termitum]|uniref:Pip protein n=1 Tax=Candidatus Methanoplasma termitum TaxID=1577791 RepID=A0A0A7LBF8_9ARCH|nr:alpha/beta hydrolase [Candidatus Methanoplasma termitum]AIZ56409.1 proline iminopeptidase [Candidatus Methanoplasma termitum]
MFVHVNGVEIYYEIDGDGSPIILLHGNGEHHRIFDRLVDDLKKNHKVFSMDTRGHGESEKVDSFHYSDMVEDVAAFIRELRIERPIVYGFSDGGIVGLMLASKYPDVLSGLIASGPNLTPKDVILKERLPMRIVNIFKRDPKVKMMIEEPNITDEDLMRIKIPVLITVAEKDIIPISHAEHIANTVGNGSLIIVPYEDHASYIVHSDRLFPLISDFVERVSVADRQI